MPKKTYSMLMEATVTYLELAGRNYIEKVREEEDGDIVGLAVLRPDRMRPVVSESGDVISYAYNPNAKTLVLPPKDVVDQYYFNPLNPDAGLSPTYPGWVIVQMDRAATQWNWDFFRNGASPDVLLSTDKPVPEGMMMRIQADFESRNRNVDGRGRRAYVLPQGLKADSMNASHREMQFEKLLTMDRAAIAALYHVPPIMLGLETMNYATADKQLQVFRREVLVPLVKSWRCGPSRSSRTTTTVTSCISTWTRLRSCRQRNARSKPRPCYRTTKRSLSPARRRA
jgi:HK97 family phage portal protein